MPLPVWNPWFGWIPRWFDSSIVVSDHISAVVGGVYCRPWKTFDPKRCSLLIFHPFRYANKISYDLNSSLEPTQELVISMSVALPSQQHQVIVGPIDEQSGQTWYFSLNNRRLWVLKRCREEGLLGSDNLVQVRVRAAKSEAETNRYTLSNCALEAKFLNEKGPCKTKKSKAVLQKGINRANERSGDDDIEGVDPHTNILDESNESSDEDSTSHQGSNPFSALSWSYVPPSVKRKPGFLLTCQN